jgi:hypothetical protein
MKKIVESKYKIVVKTDGFNDLSRLATESGNAGGSSNKGFDKSYHTSSNSLGEALGQLVDGWTGSMTTMEKVRDKVRERVGSLDVNTFRFDNALIGQYLDISSFLAGEPQCMLQAYEDTTKRANKFVRILVDVSVSWQIKPEDIATRGGAIVALCDVLNLCGYSTEVWASATCSGDKPSSLLSVLLPVQHNGSPWDIRSASFPLTNGDYLRRVIFAVQEGLESDQRECFGAFPEGAGYGVPRRSELGSMADVHCGGADIIIPSDAGSIANIVSDPVAWVLGQCKNVGVLNDSEIAELV